MVPQSPLSASASALAVFATFYDSDFITIQINVLDNFDFNFVFWGEGAPLRAPPPQKKSKNLKI